MADETENAETSEDATDSQETGEGSDTAPELVHGVPVIHPRGEVVLHPSREQYLDLVTTLVDDGYHQCIDVTAADYLRHPGRNDLPEGVEPERFELVVGLMNHAERQRIRLRVQVPESDPTVATLFAIHPGSEALEREVYDMFGITFDGHPDLTRILMPEDWEGHPLRRDYSVGRIPVQFKDAPAPR
jgi:NADH-quinone oxidoreductase subunit C